MLAKEMVPVLAPISVVIECLESIRAINIPKVKTVYHHIEEKLLLGVLTERIILTSREVWNRNWQIRS